MASRQVPRWRNGVRLFDRIQSVPAKKMFATADSSLETGGMGKGNDARDARPEVSRRKTLGTAFPLQIHASSRAEGRSFRAPLASPGVGLEVGSGLCRCSARACVSDSTPAVPAPSRDSGPCVDSRCFRLWPRAYDCARGWRGRVTSSSGGRRARLISVIPPPSQPPNPDAPQGALPE